MKALGQLIRLRTHEVHEKAKGAWRTFKPPGPIS